MQGNLHRLNEAIRSVRKSESHLFFLLALTGIKSNNVTGQNLNKIIPYKITQSEHETKLSAIKLAKINLLKSMKRLKISKRLRFTVERINSAEDFTALTAGSIVQKRATTAELSGGQQSV